MYMKKIIIPILLFFCFGYFSYAGIKSADTITPSDLGAHKWILSETTQKDEVAVFQSKTITERKNGEKYVLTSEVVSYSPKKKAEAVIFAYSPNKFNLHYTDIPKWHIRIFGNLSYIDARFSSSHMSTLDNSGGIEFKNKNGLLIKIKFKSFIIKIDEAKKRYKGLPKFNSFVSWQIGRAHV